MLLFHSRYSYLAIQAVVESTVSLCFRADHSKDSSFEITPKIIEGHMSEEAKKMYLRPGNRVRIIKLVTRPPVLSLPCL